MFDPVAAVLAGVTALSSGGVVPPPAMPEPAPAAPIVEGHLATPLPGGAQRIADPGRIAGILSGRLAAAHDQRIEIVIDPGYGPGARPMRGYDGCNGFSGQLIVTDQGGVVLGDPRRGDRVCASPVDDDFWRVLGGQTVMFAGANNTIYLTNGMESVAFFKTS